MRPHPLICIASVLISAAMTCAFAGETRFTLGVGYDQITQGYYLSEIDTFAVDEDSLLTIKRTTDEISTPRLKSRIAWLGSVSQRTELELDNLTLLSNEDIRNSTRMRLEAGALDLTNELEFRGIWDGAESERVGYFTNELRARFKPEIANGLFLVADESFELLRFDGSGLYTFDYNYNRFKIGVERQFGWVDYLLVAYRNDIRDVPDSSRIDYTRHRGIIELYWSPTWNLTIDLENEVSRTESNKEADLDDRLQELLDAEIIYRASERIRFEISDLFEYTDYDTQDVVSFNSIYNLASVECSYEFARGAEFYVKPSLTLFWSEYFEFEEQDFEQRALEYGFDISQGDWLWCDISHTYGRRDYTYDVSEFYTDYTLNELDILADLKVYDGLRLNLIFSVDWEDHELEADDNVLSLFSAGLDYRFR